MDIIAGTIIGVSLALLLNYYETKKIIKLNNEVNKLNDEIDRFVLQRLSRGNIRIQNNAFNTEAEWKELRKTQPERMARLNQKLKEYIK